MEADKTQPDGDAFHLQTCPGTKVNLVLCKLCCSLQFAGGFTRVGLGWKSSVWHSSVLCRLDALELKVFNSGVTMELREHP